MSRRARVEKRVQKSEFFPSPYCILIFKDGSPWFQIHLLFAEMQRNPVLVQKPSLKAIFWLSPRFFKYGYFEDALNFLKHKSSLKSVEVKFASESLEDLREKIISQIYDRTLQAHIIITGEDELDFDFYEGHKQYISFFKSLTSYFVFSENILLVCGFIPDARYSNLTLYRELYEETYLGLNIIKAYESSPSIYCFNPCIKLMTEKGVDPNYYCPDQNCLSRNGSFAIAICILKILSHSKLIRETTETSEVHFLNGEKLITRDGKRFFIWE